MNQLSLLVGETTEVISEQDVRQKTRTRKLQLALI